MVTEKSLITQEERLPALSRQPEPLIVSPEYVKQTVTSLVLLQDLVKKVLIPGRDYGPPYEGATSDTLYDPGASLIISAFNAYAGHRRILYFSNEHGKVAIVIEVPIIQRNTGAEVGSGIASCTVSETKYKYRWVRADKLEDWGYTVEEAKAFKTRVKYPGKEYEVIEYQVPNPELEELLNTIVTMASKRAEVDAAKSLPGVGSALRELFDRKGTAKGQQEKGKREAGEGTAEDSPLWTKYWAGVRALGLEPDQAHQMLKVKSMKDWIASSKSLDDALKELARLKGQGPTAPHAPVMSKAEAWLKVNPKSIKNYEDLENTFVELTGEPIREMYRKLGVSGRNDMTILVGQAFLSLLEEYAPTKID